MLLNCDAGEDSWETLGLLRDSKDINQSILKEINPEYSLEELMLLNCGAREDLSPLDIKKIKTVHPKGN